MEINEENGLPFGIIEIKTREKNLRNDFGIFIPTMKLTA
jgi:hypothetical protein